MPIPFQVGDRLRLKKTHPCGTNDWKVIRIGADLRLQCLGCGRYVWLPRREVERRLREHFPIDEVDEVKPE